MENVFYLYHQRPIYNPGGSSRGTHGDRGRREVIWGGLALYRTLVRIVYNESVSRETHRT